MDFIYNSSASVNTDAASPPKQKTSKYAVNVLSGINLTSGDDEQTDRQHVSTHAIPLVSRRVTTIYHAAEILVDLTSTGVFGFLIPNQTDCQERKEDHK